MSFLNEIDNIPISIASPEDILGWSHGEVKKPETINYRTFKPEESGLFCEAIFGPVKDYECASWCGNYKKGKNKGKICEKCNVEITSSSVRRERMGHIALAAPVAHFWYFKSRSYVSDLLDIAPKKLENIVYCKSHYVIDPGNTPLTEGQMLSSNEYEEATNAYGNRFQAGIGAKVIQELLKKIDLDVLAESLLKEISVTKTLKKQKLIKRLKVADSFRRSGNRPEWMIMDYLPIIPPDLRPMVQLDGGRFATSDLNDLYRRIINRNNRLKKLIKVGAPEIIIQNEMRMVQQSVDALIANHRTANPVTGSGRRVLKSLSSALEGKQGRFRQNLLGKRVDYSGRSVITVGPNLEIHQCGIPRKMALELFKPFVMNQMVEQGFAPNYAKAKKMVEQKSDEVWDVLEQVVDRHPVILNRAPTLHKLSVRAFEPIIIEGNAITLHPLVCSGFNADFDGDTMSVHIPLSAEAQAESRVLLLASRNLLHPQNGKSAVTPTQDMVLGCHYLTIERAGEKGEGKFFTGENEAIQAYDVGNITLHAKIIVYIVENTKFETGKYLVTTVGKLIFNKELPASLVYINNAEIKLPEPDGVFNKIEDAKAYVTVKENKAAGKEFLENLVSYAYDEVGVEETAKLLDALKNAGFKYATRAGITISLSDVKIPANKQEILNETELIVNEIQSLYRYGRITGEQRYEEVIKLWGDATEKVAEQSIIELEKDVRNPIKMMIDSKARGSRGQYRQLAGMRGGMADPSGRTIEKPIKANFKEGLGVFEYFISTHGARKGMADTSLKTADSGYLTRKMVDVSQDVIVSEEDCKTDLYVYVEEIKPRVESLRERIVGRVLGKDVTKEDGTLVAKRNTMIDEHLADVLVADFTRVPIRNLLVCQSKRGICKKCYGIDLSTKLEVEIGEAVGVVAAQSIGEPGTQLTMRTFHTGGVAAEADITQGLPRIQEIFEARKMDGTAKAKTAAVLTEYDGTVEIKEKNRLKDVIVTTVDGEEITYHIPYGYPLAVEAGQTVKVGDQLMQGSINPHELLRLKGMESVQGYLLSEVQRVYRVQGVEINDKHIETIIRQMSRKVIIKDPGDSGLVHGRLVDRYKLGEVNKKLRKEGKREVAVNDKLLGITEASMSTDSFLSAASFQETAKALTEAAIRGKKDHLRGLKENIITGKRIPAGTGYYSKEQK
jgi:DNA-directed RNA polymerase subunit beta'